MYSIKILNNMMKNELENISNAAFINIFDKFIDEKGEIVNKYFLIDRLHLSESGYDIWKNEVKKSLNSIL
jgi:lysophospholipase L1-like esterase